MKRYAVVLIAVTCAAAMTAAIALAHDKDYKSTVTVNAGANSVTGKVKSVKGACKKGRIVRGDLRYVGGRQDLGTDRTDRQGRYELSLEGHTHPSEYGIGVGAVEKTLSNTASHNHVCASGGKLKNFGF